MGKRASEVGRALLFALLAGYGLSAGAAVDLRIDDETIPGRSVEVLQQALTRVKFNTAPTALRRGVVENHLLAREVEGELSPANRQDLDAQVEIEAANLLDQVFGRRFDQDVRPFLREPQGLSSERLRQALAPSGGQLVLNSLQLAPEQRRAAAAVELIGWQFPGAPAQRLDLLQLYLGCNVQDQVELQQGNLARMAALVGERARRDYLWYQLGKAGYSESEQTALRRLVRDKLVRHRYLHQIGLYSDFHHETESLRELAAKVSDADAEAYYRANLAQYRNVAKVQAAHIRLADQASADRVYAELKSGLDFDEAVRRYSLAEDRQRTPPGDLGPIRPEQAGLDFVRKAALIQKTDSLSQPLRGDQGFEIIRVTGREDRQLPLSDPSVRYEVNQAVARQQLASQFEARLAALLSKARVQGL
ncbi:peptidylprolyl isomerase [Pseudomonas sp. BMS12]|uniref:peptidylprolyl isomerase n=1 Tax=Pseudomonas sp. BMS12 TaxID=1796033 RepID=UPI00083AD97B|nr:peptidylprolyl isomerase [Pseudomonas sp. BMS12]